MRPRANRCWSAGLAALALGGCYFPGGPGASKDLYTYQSTPWKPWTVNLEDTRTGETMWSVDVPVGQQLVVRFYDNRGDGERMPDLMVWGVMENGKRTGNLPNRAPVPSSTARLLEATLRPTPEFSTAPPAPPFTPPAPLPGAQPGDGDDPPSER